jgi:hypothetical protein
MSGWRNCSHKENESALTVYGQPESALEPAETDVNSLAARTRATFSLSPCKEAA